MHHYDHLARHTLFSQDVPGEAWVPIAPALPRMEVSIFTVLFILNRPHTASSVLCSRHNSNNLGTTKVENIITVKTSIQDKDLDARMQIAQNDRSPAPYGILCLACASTSAFESSSKDCSVACITASDVYLNYDHPASW